MKQTGKYILNSFFAVFSASLLALLLNHFDNKYTNPGIQPLEGQLILSSEELAARPVHYLINGWAFYPDTLLSPADLTKENVSNHYMFYTSIGEHTRFNLNNRISPYGCGTYVMYLHLPDTRHTYALELPEIFSAYHLYINDELVIQNGNPRRDSYFPMTRNRLVVFEGSGRTTLLLSVSNYSHFYSGLVYPPALGFYENIHLLISSRLILAGCVTLMGILGFLISYYLGIHLRNNNARVFSLLCIIFAFISCHPILHTVCSLPIQPWYAFEISMRQFLLFLILLLQNRICGIEGFTRNISQVLAFIVCIISLIYGLFSSLLIVSIMESFSFMLSLFKLTTAAYLISVSLYSLKKKHLNHFDPLFYSSLFYAILLIWDRILPSYEPIMTAWFSEWGVFFIIFAIGHHLLYDIINAYSFHLAFAKEHQQTKRQLSMQLSYADKIASQTLENRRMKHDFRHHIKTIREMVNLLNVSEKDEQNKDNLSAYLNSLWKSSIPEDNQALKPLCNIVSIDALLQYFEREALQLGIKTNLNLHIPENLPLDDIEWCTVLGNLLENALEGCKTTKTTKPFLRLSYKWTLHTFFLMVENTYNGDYVIKDNHFLSHKRNNKEQGLGIESVRKTVELHGGSLEIYPFDNVFQAGIVLPVISN